MKLLAHAGTTGVTLRAVERGGAWVVLPPPNDAEVELLFLPAHAGNFRT